MEAILGAYRKIFLLIIFFTQFWKERKMVGAVCPSSSFLARKMLRSIDFKRAKVIVELGAGTGIITKHLLNQMNNDAVIIVFEVNPHFFKDLENEIKDHRVILIRDNAEFIIRHMQEAGVTHADYIISSLPLSNFTDELSKSILQYSYNLLRDKGEYIQFQYSLNSKSILKSVFDRVYLSFTFFNVPPAYVYTCVKENL